MLASNAMDLSQDFDGLSANGTSCGRCDLDAAYSKARKNANDTDDAQRLRTARKRGAEKNSQEGKRAAMPPCRRRTQNKIWDTDIAEKRRRKKTA